MLWRAETRFLNVYMRGTLWIWTAGLCGRIGRVVKGRVGYLRGRQHCMHSKAQIAEYGKVNMLARGLPGRRVRPEVALGGTRAQVWAEIALG